MDIELTFPSTASAATNLLVAIRFSLHTFPFKLETVFRAPSTCPPWPSTRPGCARKLKIPCTILTCGDFVAVLRMGW